MHRLSLHQRLFLVSRKRCAHRSPGRTSSAPRTRLPRSGATTPRCRGPSCASGRVNVFAPKSRTRCLRDHRALARHPAAERDGRRSRADAGADSRGRRQVRLRIRSSRRRHVLVPPAPRRRRAARARTVRRVDRRGARPTGGRPRRGVDPVGLAPRSRSRPAPGLCERDGREPCRPDRKHRHRERRDSGGIYRQKRRTAAASADQRIERAHLRSQLRGPRALGDRARRAPGSAALVPARGARARDARRPDPRLYRRPGQPPPRGGRLLPMVAPTSS